LYLLISLQFRNRCWCSLLWQRTCRPV